MVRQALVVLVSLCVVACGGSAGGVSAGVGGSDDAGAAGGSGGAAGDDGGTGGAPACSAPLCPPLVYSTCDPGKGERHVDCCTKDGSVFQACELGDGVVLTHDCGWCGVPAPYTCSVGLGTGQGVSCDPFHLSQ